jgi:hypothetical protein
MLTMTSDYTSDPSKLVNYIIYPTAIDPKRGNTPEEIRKYTRQKVVAIAIKMFLAVVTVGFSLAFSLSLQETRIRHEQIQKAETKLDSKCSNTFRVGEALYQLQHRVSIKTGGDLSKINEDLIVRCVHVAFISLNGIRYRADDENILAEALRDSIAHPWKGNIFGPF